jgi:hypothetical protein
MPARLAGTTLSSDDCVHCGNQRCRQVHEEPEVFSLLFGVSTESMEPIVPPDTTGTVDVLGAKGSS